jgi:transglutaminase-like putative cysteine protease
MEYNYLANSDYIDWQQPIILKQAQLLARNQANLLDIAQACFEFVRDEIKHSSDYQLNPVTCKASDVLKYQTGFCYAKSHLLAALLRANQIPAGLCYQRLLIDDTAEAGYCLHGLNAIYLENYGWYRVDARGNKTGVNAQFCPPREQLAFALNNPQEQDITGIWAEPLADVIHTLSTYTSYDLVLAHLPDWFKEAT